MVYHLGERALVELHVVLDENLPLKVTHDVCEALERKVTKFYLTEFGSPKRKENIYWGIWKVFSRQISAGF